MRALQAKYRKESAAANQRDAKMFKAMFAGLAKLPDDREPTAPKQAAAAAPAPVSGPAGGLASHPVEEADGGAMEAGEDAAEAPGLQNGNAQQNGHAHTQDAPQPMPADSAA